MLSELSEVTDLCVGVISDSSYGHWLMAKRSSYGRWYMVSYLFICLMWLGHCNSDWGVILHISALSGEFRKMSSTLFRIHHMKSCSHFIILHTTFVVLIVVYGAHKIYIIWSTSNIRNNSKIWVNKNMDVFQFYFSINHCYWSALYIFILCRFSYF
jgi:hypothetical protein